MTSPLLTPDKIHALVALPTQEAQSIWLRTEGLLNETGLSFLLDFAEEQVNTNPSLIFQLTNLCEQLASFNNAPGIVPRSRYLRAQVHAMRGEFDTAIELVKQAKIGFEQLNLSYEAVRTDVGLCNLLLEIGEYDQVLTMVTESLAVTEQRWQDSTEVGSDEYQFLAALLRGILGSTHELTGHYQEALTEYGRAEQIFEALGEQHWHAIVLNNQGLIFTYLGQTQTALENFQAAALIRAEAPPSLQQAQTFINMGEAQRLMGQYLGSLQSFAEAEQLLQTVDGRVDQAINLVHQADTYLSLNLFAEALAAYQRTNDELEQLGMKHEQGMALHGLGSTFLAQEQYGSAEDALSRAAAIFESIDNRPRLATVLLEIAAIESRRDNQAGAFQRAYRALDLVTTQADSAALGGGWPVQELYANLRLADIVLAGDVLTRDVLTRDVLTGDVLTGGGGDLPAAMRYLERAELLLGEMNIPPLHFRLLQRFGRLRSLQGDLGEAERLFQEAISEIEQFRGTLSQESLRVSFMHDKMDAYQLLVELYLAQNDDESVRKALDVAERAKSRTLVEQMLLIAREKSAAEDADTVDAAAGQRLDNLVSELNAIYDGLLDDGLNNGAELTGHGGRERSVRMANLTRRAKEVEQEIVQLRLQPANDASLVPLFATFPSISEMQRLLPTDLTMIAYHVVGFEVLAFVITASQISVVRHLTTVSLIEQMLRELDQQWIRVQMGTAFAERHMSLLVRATQQALGKLYEALFRPLEAIIEQQFKQAGNTSQKIVIIPHGPLHGVPFQALYDGHQYLIEKAALSFAPSITVFALCQARLLNQSDRILVMGVVEPDIPGVEAEVRAIHRQHPGAEVYLNQEATVRILVDRAPGAAIVHLACHGLFRSDNPLFSSLKLADRWLTALDTASLKLDNALVVLSACESGRTMVMGGDEIIGLTSSCLSANAAALVVSQWLVHDESGAILAAEWYAKMGNGMEPVAALRSAQRILMESHPHPYYWAPFIYVGKRE